MRHINTVKKTKKINLRELRKGDYVEYPLSFLIEKNNKVIFRIESIEKDRVWNCYYIR